MLRTVIERAGFKELFESSRSKADTVLATVPSAVSHISCDALFERPVQAELVELLLLPKEAERFTSCVLVHGMGGTGKVSELSAHFFIQLADPPAQPRPQDGDSGGGGAGSSGARAF